MGLIVDLPLEALSLEELCFITRCHHVREVHGLLSAARGVIADADRHSKRLVRPRRRHRCIVPSLVIVDFQFTGFILITGLLVEQAGEPQRPVLLGLLL